MNHSEATNYIHSLSTEAAEIWLAQHLALPNPRYPESEPIFVTYSLGNDVMSGLKIRLFVDWDRIHKLAEELKNLGRGS